MFIGRKKELETLNSFINSSDKALLLYGKRRVGKTELIKQAFKDNCVYFECMKDTLKNNVSSFVETLIKKGLVNIPFKADTFIEVFSLLSALKIKGNIIIDEYPYLYKYSDNSMIDSHFQSIIDNYLSNTKLVLCGSNVNVMTSLLEGNNALFGRFDKIIFLDELSYIESQHFYYNKPIYDKIGFYAVFGGSPYLNLEVDENLSLIENIKRTFLNERSNVYRYCENLLFTDVPSSVNINSICDTLKNGKKTCAQIESSLNSEKNGGMNKKLELLSKMKLITKYQPINRLNNSKATKYEINDNAIRFFYSFVYKNKSILNSIGSDAFFDEYIGDKLTTFISHRFEEMVRDYISLRVKEGSIKGVFGIGTYYYDDPKTKTNGEFDVAIKLKGEKYKIIEVKYYKNNVLKVKEMKEEADQVKKISEIDVLGVAFVCTSGYEEGSEFECIDVYDMYKE